MLRSSEEQRGSLIIVVTGQEMVRKKEILQAQGEVKKFYFESGKIGILKKAPEGKIEII